MPLLPGAAESQSLQNQIGIYGRIGFRVWGHVLCNRPGYAFVNRGQQNGVVVPRWLAIYVRFDSAF
jgi:hypothetical protein